MKKILFLSLALPFMSTNAMQNQDQNPTQAQAPNAHHNVIQAQNPTPTPDMTYKI